MFGHIKFIWVNRHTFAYLWKFRSWLVKYPAVATSAVVARQEEDDKALKRKQVCDQIYNDLAAQTCKGRSITLPRRSNVAEKGHPAFSHLVFQTPGDKLVPETTVILPDGSTVDVVAARSEKLKHDVKRLGQVKDKLIAKALGDLKIKLIAKAEATPVVAKAKKARKPKKKGR